MKKIAFFDTKPYDKEWFDRFNENYEIIYYETRLRARTAQLAKNCDAVCAFVNDEIDRETIETLSELGIKVIALRCAGYSNIDFRAVDEKNITVVRVPAYSPYAIAEHAMGLLLSVNRKLHKAYYRTRDFNFSLVGLTGVDLYGKTAGVIGTGRIGRCFIDICRGFGMNVKAYDPFPVKGSDINYVTLDELLKTSDVISLHCPLTDQTKYILDGEAFSKMKKGVFILNTSRGLLIETTALLDALNSEKVRGAGLDVYEEEADVFFEDHSDRIIKDDVLSLLVSRPNVLITSHQAFLTEEALENIAKITLRNLDDYFDDRPLENEVCYRCESGKVSENCLDKRKSNDKKVGLF